MSHPRSLHLLPIALLASSAWAVTALGDEARPAPSAAAKSVVPEPPAPAHALIGDAVPPLPDVMTLARQRSGLVVSSEASARAVRSLYAGARLGAVGNPYMELTAWRAADGVSKGVPFNAAFWIPLDLAGQPGARVAEVDAAVELADSSTKVARAAVAGEAVRVYGAVAVAFARVKAADEILQTSRDEAKLYEARVLAKDSTQADLTLALVEVARNGVSLTEARADLVKALSELARLTGRDAYGPSQLPLEPPGGDPRVKIDEVPSVELSNREAAYFRRAAERQRKEAQPPVSLMVQGGRGDLAELRWTLGVAWTFPVFRANQGERARAAADAQRARVDADVKKATAGSVVRGLVAERKEIHAAVVALSEQALPAARAAVDAAIETHRAGKTELLRVFSARRDLAMLRLRQLELVRREWEIVADMVRVTGELP